MTTDITNADFQASTLPPEQKCRVGIVVGDTVEDSEVAALLQCIRKVPEFVPPLCFWAVREIGLSSQSSQRTSLGEIVLEGALSIDAFLERRRADREATEPDAALSAVTLTRVELGQYPSGDPHPEAITAIVEENVDLCFFLGEFAPPEWLVLLPQLGTVTARRAHDNAVLARDSTRGSTAAIERLLVLLYTAGRPPACLLHSHTARRSISPARNRQMLKLRMADLIVRMGRRVVASGVDTEVASALTLPLSQTDLSDRELSLPTFEAMRRATQILQDRVRAASDSRFFDDRWVMGYSREPIPTLNQVSARLPEFNVLHPPTGCMWADPFPVRHEGRDLIFFEEEFRREGYGHISVAELLPTGELTRPTRVLDIGCHLSYPCLLKSESEWFMIPESSESGSVSLYRAIDFPFRWQKEVDLLHGQSLVDCTVFRHNNQWWMLGCRVGPDHRPYEDLEAFHAESLLGPWTPHRRNPIVSDARYGRPAGNVFVESGKLIRPAQDCTVRYGFGLTFQEIISISATEFEERTVASRVADWSPSIKGLHTFNRSSTLSCTDYYVRTRRSRTFHRLISKFPRA